VASSTRSPSRPNPIGISVVRLLHREGASLVVADIDVLDETPLLDIKIPLGAARAPDTPARDRAAMSVTLGGPRDASS
jgi:tRNA (Thr-GGU) A37 N-methylase